MQDGFTWSQLISLHHGKVNYHPGTAPRAVERASVVNVELGFVSQSSSGTCQ